MNVRRVDSCIFKVLTSGHHAGLPYYRHPIEYIKDQYPTSAQFDWSQRSETGTILDGPAFDRNPRLSAQCAAYPRVGVPSTQ
jgi:hypothetical protein